MIKISTPLTSSLQHETTQNSCAFEDLDKEENSFYDFLKADLNQIVKSPCAETITRILNYSKIM